jgi:hypothetical protein
LNFLTKREKSLKITDIHGYWREKQAQQE